MPKLSVWNPNPTSPEIFLRLADHGPAYGGCANEAIVELVNKEGTRLSSGAIGVFHLDSNGKLNFRRSGGVNTAHVAIDINGMIKTN